MKNRNINILDPNASPTRIVLTLAAPVILGMILNTIGQYINVAMVGSLGAKATASVSINASVMDMMQGIMHAVALGFAVLVAQNIGRGEIQEAKAVARQALTTALLVGLLMALLLYGLSGVLPGLFGAEEEIIPDAIVYTRIIAVGSVFRILIAVCSMILQFSGDTRTPTLYNILAVFLQVICNIFLIFPTRTMQVLGISFTLWGAGMGVAGSGLALLIAQTVNAACQAGTLFIKKMPIRLRIRGRYRPDKLILAAAAKTSVPNILEKMTLSFAYIVITPLVAKLGTVAIAANALAITVESMCYLPCFGFSIASTTLVAQTIGADMRCLAHQYIRVSSYIAVTIMTAAGALMFLFAKQLMGIFTNDPEVIRMGVLVLRIEAFAEPGYALASVLSGAFRGMGDARRPFYYSAVGMWCVRIVLSYILVGVFHMGLTGVWIGMMMDWNVRGMLCLLRIRKVNKGLR